MRCKPQFLACIFEFGSIRQTILSALLPFLKEARGGRHVFRVSKEGGDGPPVFRLIIVPGGRERGVQADTAERE